MYDEIDLLSLRAPAGNGQENDPDDIAALDSALRRIDAYTPPPEYAAGPQRYATEPMIDALNAFQEQNGLKTDSYANPGGPTERAINNRLLGKPKGTGLLFEPPGPLAGTVGNGFRNERRDVATVQRMLGALEYMPEDPYDRPPGFIDERTTAATRRYQRDMGLEPDGWMAPGGETETALHNSISDLVRDKGRDWFACAERAGMAQARMLDQGKLSAVPAGPDDAADRDDGVPQLEPVRWEPDIWGGWNKSQRILEGSGGAVSRGGAWDRSPPPPSAPGAGAPAAPRPLPPPPIVPPTVPRDETGEGPDGRNTRRVDGSWVRYAPESFRANADGLIIERRGSKAVQDYDADLTTNAMKQAQTVAKTTSREIRHEAGARALEDRKDEKTGVTSKKGENVPQRKVGPRNELGKPIDDQRFGHSFPDMAFHAVPTGRRLFINSYTSNSSGGPDSRERGSALRLQRNAETGDIVLLVPKLGPNEILDAATFHAIVFPLLMEICLPYTPSPDKERVPMHIEKDVRRPKP